MNTKICYKCKIEKPLSEFHKNCRKLDGYNHLCKLCEKERHSTYYLENKEKIDLQHKTYYELNKEEIIIRNSKWAKNNEDRMKELRVSFYNQHPHYDRDYIRNKTKIDIRFRIKKSLGTRIRNALKGINKSKQTLELLGCSVEFLKNHLESQFKEGMTWKNYGKGGWVIDHIRPCVSFDLCKLSEQKKCFNYSNLQPLWEIDNLHKHAKIL